MRWCLFAVLTLSTGMAFPAAAERDPTTPFQLRDGSDIIVPVLVGGRGPYQFLLDTGSSRSAVAEGLAGTLGLPRTGLTIVRTPAGEKTRPLAFATLQLGDASGRLWVMVLQKGDLGPALDGIIGSDFLSIRSFTIDYGHRRMSFDSRADEPRGAVVPLTHGPSGYSVTLPGRRGERSLRFVPDTGTAGFVLFDRKDRALPPITPLQSSPVRTLAGLRVGRTVLLERLDIGTIPVRDQLATLLDGSIDDARFGDGLMPLHLFAQVRFDGAGGSLTLVPHSR